MKHKTEELKGVILDAAVASAKGLPFRLVRFGSAMDHNQVERCVIDGLEALFEPSSRWEQGGPIIEREQISLAFTDMEGMIGDQVGVGPRWFAGCPRMRRSSIEGDTPLVAAMRSFVAAIFGDEVDL